MCTTSGCPKIQWQQHMRMCHTTLGLMLLCDVLSCVLCAQAPAGPPLC